MTERERNPEPASASPDAPEARPASAPDAPLCDLCGFPMRESHCKLICDQCSYTRDCSDP